MVSRESVVFRTPVLVGMAGRGVVVESCKLKKKETKL
jgi:hypothetical protein